MFHLLTYLDKYNLCSQKYLQYYYVRKSSLLVQHNKHLTQEGSDNILYYNLRISQLKHSK